MNGRENCWRRRCRVSGSFESTIDVLRCRIVPLALVFWVNLSSPVDGTVLVTNRDDREVMQYTRMEIRSILPTTTTTTNIIYIRIENANDRWFIIQMLSPTSREASHPNSHPCYTHRHAGLLLVRPRHAIMVPVNASAMRTNIYPLPHGRVLSYINVKNFLSSLKRRGRSSCCRVQHRGRRHGRRHGCNLHGRRHYGHQNRHGRLHG